MTTPLLSDTNRWFEHFDRNGSGHLDQNEVVSALFTTFGGDQKSIRETVVAIWPAFDRNGSGTIERHEFCGPGGMGESLLAAMQQQQQSSAAPPQQQPRAYAPSVYVPQGPSSYVQPTAPPESPRMSQQASASTSSSDSNFWQCDRCSFVNSRTDPACKACHSSRSSHQASSIPQQQPATTYVPQQQSASQSSYVYQAPTASQSQYTPAPVPYQPHTASQSSYVYQAPAASQSHYTPAPASYQPQQPAPQTQSATQSDGDMQTFRVLIPQGMGPSQSIKVDTGSMNPPPTVVSIPAKSTWGRMPDGQSYFDVQLRKESQATPVTLQGSYVAAAPGSRLTSSTTTSYSQSTAATGQPQTSYAPSQSHTSHTSSISHQAPPTPVGNPRLALISPQHVTSTATTLVLKERSMSYSGDDAQIKDESGNIVFYVQAELMTMSQRRFMVDTRGQKIGQLRHKKSPGLHPTVYIGTVSDEKKCSVKMSGMMDPFNCDAQILLGQGKKIGKISGNWRAKKFTITIDGQVVANVLRKRTMSSMFMGADTYCIDVQPGVDLAFVSLVAVALDELYNDKGGGRQGGGGIGGSFGPGW